MRTMSPNDLLREYDALIVAIEVLDQTADREDFVAFAPKHIVIHGRDRWDGFVALARASKARCIRHRDG